MSHDDLDGQAEMLSRMFDRIWSSSQKRRRGGASNTFDENASNNNDRLHVKLNQIDDSTVTHIMMRRHWGGEAVVKSTLDLFWESFFGEYVSSDVFYDENFTYCFLSFPNHEEAATALANLNKEDIVLAAIQRLLAIPVLRGGKSDPQQYKKTQQEILSAHLLSNATMLNGRTNRRASWARPRRSRVEEYDDDDDDYFDDRDYYDDYFDDRDYYDDCPDEIDRDEWRAYSEGRG